MMKRGTVLWLMMMSCSVCVPVDCDILTNSSVENSQTEVSSTEELTAQSNENNGEKTEEVVERICDMVISRILQDDRRIIKEEVERLLKGSPNIAQPRLKVGDNEDLQRAADRGELEVLLPPRKKKTNGDPERHGNKSAYSRHSNEIYSSSGAAGGAVGTHPNLLRLEVRVGRLERQLASQGHTLAGHWDRLAAQHGLLLRQAEASEQRLAKLSHVTSEVELAKARLNRVVIDNHWQEVKIRAIDNKTIALRQGIRQMDGTIHAMYADHGHFYQEIESLNKKFDEVKLAQKKAESRTNLLENSLRYLIYMQNDPSPNVSLVEENIKWLRNSTYDDDDATNDDDKTEMGGVGFLFKPDHLTRLSVKALNKTLSKLAASSSDQQYQMDEMSLDLEQLKDEVYTFYKYLEAMQDRIRELQPGSHNMTFRKGMVTDGTIRFLMGKMEELQREVSNLKMGMRESGRVDPAAGYSRKLNTSTTAGQDTVSESVMQETSTLDSRAKDVLSNTTRPYENISVGFLTAPAKGYKEKQGPNENKNQVYHLLNATESVENLEKELSKAIEMSSVKTTTTQAAASPIRSSKNIDHSDGLKSMEVNKNLKGESLKNNQEGSRNYQSTIRTKGTRKPKVRHLTNGTGLAMTSTPVLPSSAPPTKPAGQRSKVKGERKEKQDDREEHTGWSSEMLDVGPHDQDVCTMWGLQVGYPRIVARMSKAMAGTWMRDSRARENYIYVLKDNFKVNNLRLYQNEAMLASGNYSTVYTMPFRCTGTGHVMYNGSLYCNKFMSNRLMKYDLDTGEVLSRRLKKAGFNNTYPYSCGAYTDLDFAVDEVGLWLVYSTTGDIIIAKINPQTLEVQREWVTDFPKQQALNSFMICGRLYVVSTDADSNEIEHTPDTSVTYIYDIRTGEGKTLPHGEIPIVKTSDFMTMMDYNPKDSRLYAWQMNRDWLGEMVMYDVYFTDAF